AIMPSPRTQPIATRHRRFCRVLAAGPRSAARPSRGRPALSVSRSPSVLCCPRPSLDRLRSLAAAYATTLAALLTERDEVAPLIAAIARADARTLSRLLDALT
ncbi:MAG: hypothetical protein ACPL8I_10140, partial [Chloroflexaceae bacterium]